LFLTHLRRQCAFNLLKQIGNHFVCEHMFFWLLCICSLLTFQQRFNLTFGNRFLDYFELSLRGSEKFRNQIRPFYKSFISNFLSLRLRSNNICSYFRLFYALKTLTRSLFRQKNWLFFLQNLQLLNNRNNFLNLFLLFNHHWFY
jgi:hypothetical protein